MIICLVSGVPLNQHHTDSSLKARFPQHCLLSDGLAVAREMLGFQFEGRLIGGFPTAFPALECDVGFSEKVCVASELCAALLEDDSI
jgi:hypothetical protein